VGNQNGCSVRKGEGVTAEKVGKYKVIAVEPVMRREKGGIAVANPTYDRLVLENGDKIYGCKNCEYTSNNTGSMFGHVRRHQAATQSAEPAEPAATEEPKPAQPTVSESVKNMTVGELLEYISWLEGNGGSPMDLRERAEAAEAQVIVLEEKLARIRDSLG